jgi:hypothetical protein
MTGADDDRGDAFDGAGSPLLAGDRYATSTVTFTGLVMTS